MILTNHQRLLSEGWRYDAGTKRYRDPQTGDRLDERAATERAYWRDWEKGGDAGAETDGARQLELFGVDDAIVLDRTGEIMNVYLEENHSDQTNEHEYGSPPLSARRGDQKFI
jgi:hypothetical protein